MLRKGGIKEPTFKPEATEFLLFPTAFHVADSVLKEGVAERYAEVNLTTYSSERCHCLARLHDCDFIA